MPRKVAAEAGSIRKRGQRFQIRVRAGIDPVTGKELVLTGSASTMDAASAMRRRFLVQVDEQRHDQTKATFRAAMEKWLRIHEVDASTRESYEMYARLHLYPVFGELPVGRVTAEMLEEFYAELRRCSRRCRNGEPAVDHRVVGPHECRVVRHRRRVGRPRADDVHDCVAAGCTVVECPPHRCKPLSGATIRRIHFAIRGMYAADERWGWVTRNPAEIARKPRSPAPEPDPPTVEQAARIIEAAWAEDPNWGTLVWLVMVTGVRRAELLAMQWNRIDFDAGTMNIRRNWVGGEEKDTKTHQMRRISLDAATLDVLAEHRARYVEELILLGQEPSDQAYLFSYRPLRDRPANPSGVTHRYARMCAKLGIDSHLHALRHYSATELLAAGVDLRTVAGRLGHAGGGATTLKVYAAWVGESDRRAAEILGGRMKRPDHR
jgi:integrase